MKKRNKIKGIIFDLGGVLVDDLSSDFYRNIAKQLDISASKLTKTIQEEEHLLERGEETSVQFWHRVCRKLNIKKRPSDRILASLWLRNYKQNTKAKKEVINLVKRLKRKYSLAVLSNTIKEHSVIDRRRKNLFKHFDVVLLSNEVGLRKPEKEFFKLASKKLGIPFSNLLYIDNDIRWVRAGQKLGLQSTLFKSVIHLEKALRKLRIHLNN